MEKVLWMAFTSEGWPKILELRDAVLNAQIVFPSTATVQSAHYAGVLRKLLTYGN